MSHRSRGDDRYEQGFRDGAEYAAGSIFQGRHEDSGQEEDDIGDASGGSSEDGQEPGGIGNASGRL